MSADLLCGVLVGVTVGVFVGVFVGVLVGVTVGVLVVFVLLFLFCFVFEFLLFFVVVFVGVLVGVFVGVGRYEMVGAMARNCRRGNKIAARTHCALVYCGYNRLCCVISIWNNYYMSIVCKKCVTKQYANLHPY